MADSLDSLTSVLSDRYTVEREHGAGGMATVYLAHDIKHDRKVAVKVLRPELAAVLGTERFLNEIRVTANLSHPHILPLLDSGAAEEQLSARPPDRPSAFLYYVMPFVEGESLREKLNREKQLSIEESLEITKSVASALDYAHRQNVIHRDIKPENILLHDGQPVVADFGISLAVSAAGGTRLTETGLSLGTPQYMSPEQATGDREIDGRSDVYSLACVLYEMLVGDPPHIGSTAQAVLAKVVTDEPRPVYELRSTVPIHVAGAVHKALAKLPADRFKTAQSFASAVTSASSHENQDSYFFSRYTKSKPALGVGIPERVVWAIALVAVLAVALWALLGKDSIGGANEVVRSTVQLPNSAPVRFIGSETFEIGHRSVALSPDGMRMVFVGGTGDEERLYLRLLSDRFAQPIEGTEGAYSPFFSWDGEAVGFFVGSELQVVSLRGGQPVTLAENVSTNMGAAWGADGRIVFASETGYQLWSISERGEETAALVVNKGVGGASGYKWPSFLPDGRRVLTSGIVDDIWVVDLDNGEAVQVEGITGGEARYVSTGHLLFTRGSELLAVPFDSDALEILGTPTSVLSGLRTEVIGAAQYDISEAGTLIYAEGTSAAEGELVTVSGRNSVDTLPFGPQRYGPMRYAPDGRSIAVTVSQAYRSVWIYDLVRNAPRRLTHPGSENGGPVWSPDGTHLAFWSDRTGERVTFVQPVDGSGEARMVPGPWPEYYPEFWSSSGYLVLDVITADRSWDVVAVEMGGDTSIVNVASSEGMDWGGVISPDGKLIAYTSSEPGDIHVIVQAFPVPSGKLQVSTSPNSEEPVWSPDGRMLYYRNGQRWMAVDIETTPTLAAGTPRVVFEGDYTNVNYRSYDISPDGRSFVLVAGTADEAPSQLQMVQGWFSELRELAPRR